MTGTMIISPLVRSFEAANASEGETALGSWRSLLSVRVGGAALVDRARHAFDEGATRRGVTQVGRGGRVLRRVYEADGL